MFYTRVFLNSKKKNCDILKNRYSENAPAPLDSAIHLEPYPFDVCIKAIIFFTTDIKI